MLETLPSTRAGQAQGSAKQGDQHHVDPVQAGRRDRQGRRANNKTALTGQARQQKAGQ